MYPPDNGSTYSGHSYGSYNSGYPPIDDLNRSLGSQGSNGGLGNKRYSQVNNPAVGAGPMSTQMPSAPAGFNFSGGPGGFNGPGGFSDPGGFMVPPPHSNGFGGGSSYPPPPGGGYPPANNMYPPPGGGGHPPANNMYPPGNNMYPPANNGGYPPANNNSHPPRNGGYPPMGGGYSQPPLPPRNQFDSGYPPRASCGGGNQRPPASAGPGMSGPGNNSSMQSVNGPKPSPINQSAPELNKQTPARPPPQDGGGPRPSSYRPTGSSSVGSIPPAQNNVNRGMYWSPVNSQNTRIPADAVRAGTYKNDPVFVGRTKHKDSLQVGMVTMAKEGLVIVYDGKPILFREYEVLCGPVGKYKWITTHGRLDPKDIKDGRPLSCGHEKSGEALYAAVTSIHGRDYVGKASTKIRGMLYPHKGSEEKTKTYTVLCEV